MHDDSALLALFLLPLGFLTLGSNMTFLFPILLRLGIVKARQ